MLDFTQNFFDGIMVGSAYALLGIGFSLIFGAMRRFNLAYGPTIMVGVYAGWALTQAVAVPLILAFLLTLAASIAVGIVVDLVCFRALKRAHPLAPLMSTLGMWMLLEEAVVHVFSSRAFAFPNPLQDYTLEIGELFFRGDYLALFIGSVILTVLLYLFLYRSKAGRAMRAVAEDPTAAQILGINLTRTNANTFILTSGLGGAIGFLVSMANSTIYPGFGIIATLKGLVVMILGGLGSIPGAILGGFLLGVIEIESLWYLGLTYRDIFAYLLLILFLAFRPSGLLGEKIEEI